MKKLYIRIVQISWVFLFFQCRSVVNNQPANPTESTVKAANATTFHYNIIIAPDLSSRLSNHLFPKVINDAQIIKLVSNNIYPTILREKRDTYQEDIVRVDFINKGLINIYKVNTKNLSIDFREKTFRDQRHRIDYILANKSAETLKEDTIKLNQEISQLISKASENVQEGADVWTYFNSGLNDPLYIINQPWIKKLDKMEFTNEYKNILILLTDGYIEAGIYNGCKKNQCYDLSASRIEKFRQDFLKSGITDIQEFFNKGGYGIIPVSNPYLKNLEVLVMELYDRSKTRGGAAMIHPTDLEIIQLFWNDWFQKSHVKKWELKPYVSSTEQAEDIILKFIGATKKTPK